MKDIVREGHPALRKISEEVPLPLSADDKELLEKMLQFLKNSQDEEISEKHGLRAGVGLAAPQLGINKRLIAVHFEDSNGTLYSEGLANPRIISHSVQRAYLAGGEGCLSVDRDVEGYVPRYRRLTLKATNIEGEEIEIRLRNYSAIVFQHEIDHLDGIMFYDHINTNHPYQIPDNAKEI